MKRISIDYYFIGLLGVVAGVVYYKLPQLNVPYFWDEAWVYAPAVQEMYKNGLGLLPSSLPPELSRGHPLLFHFLGALWLKIFGADFTSVHSYPLFISVLLLFAVYNFGKSLFAPVVGFSAALLLAVQPVFLSQSAMLLPEVMMALWAVLAIHAYLKDRKILFIAFATLMLFTKESGLVLLAAIGCWILFENLYLNKKKFYDKDMILQCLLLTVPLAFVSIFFIIQYFQHGWFFYPEHVGMLTINWKDFHEKLLNIYGFVLQGQGRYLLYISFFFSASLFWKLLSDSEKILIPLIYLTTTYILFNLWGSDDRITIFITLLLFAKLFQLIFIKIYYEDKEKGTSLSLMGLFVFIYFIFCQLNFLSLRYLLLLFPIVFVIIYGLLFIILENQKWIFTLIAIVCTANCFRQITKYDMAGDFNMSYLDAIKTQQEAIQHCETTNLHEQKIFTSFILNNALSQKSAGYLSGSNEFSEITDTLTSDVEYCLFTNIDLQDISDSLLNVSDLRKIKSFQNNDIWVDIYTFHGFRNDSLGKGKNAALIKRKTLKP
ncbi:MAG: hypothetical protein POELPBGB_00910 [Bacteroidia bacterium]|nr:hypothetical protein [Bacteroidia bacterium]